MAHSAVFRLIAILLLRCRPTARSTVVGLIAISLLRCSQVAHSTVIRLIAVSLLRCSQVSCSTVVRLIALSLLRCLQLAHSITADLYIPPTLQSIGTQYLYPADHSIAVMETDAATHSDGVHIPARRQRVKRRVSVMQHGVRCASVQGCGSHWTSFERERS